MIVVADTTPGEREEIALAEEVSADLLLVDDWEARRRGPAVAGTVRVLADGAAAGLLLLRPELSPRQLRLAHLEQQLQRVDLLRRH